MQGLAEGKVTIPPPSPLCQPSSAVPESSCQGDGAKRSGRSPLPLDMRWHSIRSASKGEGGGRQREISQLPPSWGDLFNALSLPGSWEVPKVFS